MAADLATLPPSGIWVQSCGDCHLANFGTYAAPDGTPVFDITDFDETLPAPFEWDLKRLAVSFVVHARSRGMADRPCRHIARGVVAAYRQHMAATMRLDPLSTWRSRIDVTYALQTIEDAKPRERELKRLRAAADAHRKGLSEAAGTAQERMANTSQTAHWSCSCAIRTTTRMSWWRARHSRSTSTACPNTARYCSIATAWWTLHSRSSGSVVSARSAPSDCSLRATTQRCCCSSRRRSIPCSLPTPRRASIPTRASASSPVNASCRGSAMSSSVGRRTTAPISIAMCGS